MRPRTKRNDVGAANTNAATGCSISRPNPKKIARRGRGLKACHPVGLNESSGVACDLMKVVATRLQRRHGLAWATAQLNARLAGLGGSHE